MKARLKRDLALHRNRLGDEDKKIWDQTMASLNSLAVGQISAGRKRIWSEPLLYYLWWDVQSLNKQKGGSEREACRELIGCHQGEWSRWSESTLWRRYCDSKNTIFVRFTIAVIKHFGWSRCQEFATDLLSREGRAQFLAGGEEWEELKRSIPKPRLVKPKK